MKGKILYARVVLVVLAMAAWLVICQMGKDAAKARKTVCLNNLQLIGRAITEYREDHSGNYPISLEALYPKYLVDRRSLRCFGDLNGTNTDVTSYAYFRPEAPPSPRMVIVQDNPGNHSAMHGHWVLYGNGELAWVED